MSRWWSGFATGVAAGLLVWVLIGGGATRGEIFARAGAAGAYLLDVRLDESALGRATNIPAATLGEATLTKRSWLVLTDYDFSLRLRAEVTPGTSAALRGLEVSARLPGSPRETNADRVTAGTAVWESLGTEPLHLRTRAVHWVRITLLGLAAAIVIVFGRRSGRASVTQ